MKELRIEGIQGEGRDTTAAPALPVYEIGWHARFFKKIKMRFTDHL